MFLGLNIELASSVKLVTAASLRACAIEIGTGFQPVEDMKKLNSGSAPKRSLSRSANEFFFSTFGEIKTDSSFVRAWFAH